MNKAVTIDLEDWYQGIEQPFAAWPRFKGRLEIGTEVLLQILAETQTQATFFVLGWLAEQQPKIIRRIADAGHEIASHGYDHEKLYHLTPGQFRAQLERAKKATEDAAGCPVLGHRAPYFSLTANSLWAIDVLGELGFTFDSSIYPGKNWRYGIPGTPDTLYRLKDSGIVEFPVSTFELLGKQTTGLGGAYFRILPLHFTLKALRQRDAAHKVSVFYLHPWEFDPHHPAVRFRWKAMLTHYFNLGATARRFRRLLQEYRFTTMSNVIQASQDHLPRVDFE